MPSLAIARKRKEVAPTPKHTFSESMLLETIDHAEPIITRWDPDPSSRTHSVSLFGGDRKEAKEFLRCIEELRRAMDFIVSTNSYTDKLVMAQKLLLVAMRRLEKEFYAVLSENGGRRVLGSVSDRSLSLSSRSIEEVRDGPEEEARGFVDDAMADLRKIADCMTSSGYGRECVKIYVLMRRSVVDEGLYQLGIETFKPAVVQKLSRVALEHMIKNWLKAVSAATETLFAGERILCDHVFSVSITARESIFSNVCKEGALNLLRFPEMVAKTKPAAEKVYRMMDMYDVTLKLWPEIEVIFSYEETSVVRFQALSSLVKLGDSIQRILAEFEAAIQKDTSRNNNASIRVHPLTCKVMKFLNSLTAYGAILAKILSDHPLSGKLSFPESYFETHSPEDASESALALHLARFVLVLLCKLDSKTEVYKDASMSYLFLASNLNYVVETVKATNLGTFLGQGWVSKHEEKVELYMSSYESIAWKKAISTLPESRCAAASMESVKDCFMKFNAAFVEAYRKQASVTLLDEGIRDKVKASLAKKLVASYQHFYETYLVMLRTERNLHLVVKFSPNDKENYISELFCGTAA
ncbi:hypothetical protein MLD38_003694 [Melastoma candidum]|uniref:Uncharacterized protein n=1 Tax=Melastoma candidum TaxID=119954 RepID=A0ACB9S797_9MYRT|nr:hypothetical protein MLD38_003694 [Melastoma candidum]